MTALALCTTIYPGAKRYVADWYRSVRQQTDQDFQLWIGLDQVDIEAARGAMGADLQAVWVSGMRGDTPAQIRQRVLARVAEHCDAVVLADSDDLLQPTRVASARVMLETGELVGCALRLVDEEGLDLNATVSLPPATEPDDVLPRQNIFGLSNTALRSDLLRRCLPIPAATALVDWFLATRAWLLGARLAFDNGVGMYYRQHEANMTRIIPPFDMAQVALETERIRRHFRILHASPPDGAVVGRLAELARVAADVETFYREVVLKVERLEQYVEALNTAGLPPLWGSCVASPLLRHMWVSEKEPA